MASGLSFSPSLDCFPPCRLPSRLTMSVLQQGWQPRERLFPHPSCIPKIIILKEFQRIIDTCFREEHIKFGSVSDYLYLS